MSRFIPGCLSLALASLTACGGTGASVNSNALSQARLEEPDGARAFALYCASCHGEWGDAPDSPAVMGDGALALEGPGRRAYRTAGDLYEYLRTRMPPGESAGSLSDEDYFALTEYLLRANGHAVPSGGVTSDNAAGLAITRTPQEASP